MRLSISITFLLSLFLLSCSSDNSNLHITTSVEKFAGKKVYLSTNNGTEMVNLDSCMVSETGEIELKATIDHTDFYYIQVAGETDNFVFVAAPNEDIQVSFTNFPQDYSSIEGSAHTNDFYEYHTTTTAIFKKRQAIIDEVKSGNKPQQIAMQEINDIQTEITEYSKKFIEQKPNSPANLSAIQNMNPVENIDILKGVLANLESTMKGSPYLVNLKDHIAKVEQQAIQQKQQKELEAQQLALLAPGNQAPEISLPNPNGKEIKLSDLKGKVVLIDFWASWCKPCRFENPNVVKVYNKYKNKGFEILGVSLDRNKDAWINAINQDKLTWKHVSDLKFWSSEAAKTYGVKGIPFTVLVDKEGKIIATKLRGKALEDKLAELFS